MNLLHWGIFFLCLGLAAGVPAFRGTGGPVTTVAQGTFVVFTALAFLLLVLVVLGIGSSA